jgi:hypothetical protein
LYDCGDISTVIPSFLQNLKFLIQLEIFDCPGVNWWKLSQSFPKVRRLTKVF